MGKATEDTARAPAAAPDTAPEQTAFEVTLDEFCTRLSKTEGRVELIGGFHHDEAANGRVKDSESAFKKRFDDFATKPV